MSLKKKIQPLITINGKPYHHLDLLTLDDELKINDEVCWGMARSDNLIFSVGDDYSRGDAYTKYFDSDYVDVKHARQKLSVEEKERIKRLNVSDFKKQQIFEKYLKFKKGAYYPWRDVYPIMWSQWNDQQEHIGKYIREEAKRLFPYTIEWIYEKLPFDVIGRINVFGIDSCQHVTVHRDNNPFLMGEDHNSIMICPLKNKRSFIYDQENDIKHHVDSNCYVFHDLNFHGVDPDPSWTYSIRVDGIFTDEFLNQIEYRRPWNVKDKS